MKYTSWVLIALFTVTIGVFGATIAWARVSKRLGSPRMFEWRNPLRPLPKVDLRPDSPLLISNPRYYSFMSIGSGVGGKLRFEITNRSDKVVHSYQCRYVPVGHGSYGSQPVEGLLPGQSRDDSISAHEYRPLTLTIDFVQFADGTTWFSNVRAPFGADNNPEFGIFGFYCGVTNIAVRVEHEYKNGGAQGIETFLRS